MFAELRELGRESEFVSSNSSKVEMIIQFSFKAEL